MLGIKRDINERKTLNKAFIFVRLTKNSPITADVNINQCLSKRLSFSKIRHAHDEEMI